MSSSSGWFPFPLDSVSCWRDRRGLPLSTASDDAARFLDSAVSQLVLMDSDPQVEGGMMGALAKAEEADPDMVMAKVVKLNLEAMGAMYKKKGPVQKKIFDLQQMAKAQKGISKWELDHVTAVSAVSRGDWLTACSVWDEILVSHPLDPVALNSLFYGALHTGCSQVMRDAPARVVRHYKEEDKYYGHVHGYLCFGHEECGQYTEATKHGDIALTHSPRDIWARHSMAHVLEETLQPRKGAAFLRDSTSLWAGNGSLNCHLWWHTALMHFQLGEYEQAVTIYDEEVKTKAMPTKMPFPLSDSVALLLRLQLYSSSSSQPVLNLTDRWRELGRAYLDLTASVDNVFYDFHALVGCLFGGERAAAERLRGLVEEQAAGVVGEAGYNSMVAKEVGVDIMKAAIAYADGDYAHTVSLLYPLRFKWHHLLGGSHAQKEIIDLLLLRAAVSAGQRARAEQLLDERVARAGARYEEALEGGDSNLVQRVREQVALMH